jgi:conjugal transfer mating pair stabilization protein TraN
MKLVVMFFILVNCLNAMNCSNYKDFQLFNGHYYSVSIDKLTFENAKQIAINNGGTLAIPNSQVENDFIKTLIGGGSTAWIGIYDPNKLQNYCYGTNCAYDSSRFKDVKNNSLLYKNFYSNEPDNLVKQYDVVDGKQMVSPLGEHWVGLNGNNGKWYDFGNHADEHNNPVKYKAVFEFENLNECTPPTDDGVQELTGRFCNTKIWDSSIDILTVGQTLDCQIDINGNEYCPSALAECGQSWDYDSGYSTSGIGQVVDYTNKISSTETAISTFQNRFYGHRTSYYNRGQPYLYSGDFGNGFYVMNYFDTGWVNIPNDNRVYQTNSFKIKYFNGATDDSAGYIISTVTNYYEYRIYQGVLQNRFYGQRAKHYGNYYYDMPYSNYSYNCINCDRILDLSIGQAYIENFDTGWQTVTTIIGARSGVITKYETPDDMTYKVHYFNFNDYRLLQYCTNGSTPINGQCVTLTCPDGYTETTGEETTKGQCKKTKEYTYYNYICDAGYSPINSGGNSGKIDTNTTNINDLTDDFNSAEAPLNNCKKEKFICLSNSERPCSYVDNKWQCSPFPCLGQSNLESLDTQVGSSDKNNDGWTEDGSCAGNIYIFNGKSNKCRTWDMFFGLIGGGCCDKEKVFAGLVGCKENEKILAKKREQKQAHYIGNFCSKKLKLGLVSICVQKSDSYCSFNSSLGKIIQEQGRTQLGISWGSPENPQCRGFTPEEFQKIDFSKIDLTEFVKDIQNSVQTSVIQNLGTYVKDKVGGFYGN